MASVATWERELLEEVLHAFFGLRRIRVCLAPDSFKVEVGDQARSAVARSRNYKGIKVVLLDHAVEVDVPILLSFAFVMFKPITYVNDCPASLPQ